MNYALPLIVLAASLRVAAAPFQDLGFDEANTNRLSGLGGPIADMLPGWQLRAPTGPLSFIGYNLVPIGLGVASIYDANIPQYNPAFQYPIEGRYALGVYPGTGNPFTLSQAGAIPEGSKTIHFVNFGGPFELRVNDSPISLISVRSPQADPLSNYPAMNVYGDISQFAGQQVELEFVASKVSGFAITVNGIDSISFSPEAIPEPSTYTLIGLGLIGFVVQRKLRPPT